MLQEFRDRIVGLEAQVETAKASAALLEQKFRNSKILAKGLHAELRRVSSVATSLVRLRNLIVYLALFLLNMLTNYGISLGSPFCLRRCRPFRWYNAGHGASGICVNRDKLKVFGGAFPREIAACG